MGSAMEIHGVLQKFDLRTVDFPHLSDLGLLDGSLSREACRMTYSILFRYCRSAHVKF